MLRFACRPFGSPNDEEAASQVDFLKCQEVFLKDDMDFQKLAGYVWPQDTPRLLQQKRAWFRFDV